MIEPVLDQFFGIFNGVDFTDLYDWLPADIQNAIGLILSFLLVLALLGLVRRFLLR